jgi:hypothetical protein
LLTRILNEIHDEANSWKEGVSFILRCLWGSGAYFSSSETLLN